MFHQISPSPRVRRSPYYDATVADGVVSFTSYNHMLMPTGYGDPMAEYDRLISGVAMWDVAVERQVELNGPDAARLAQTLAPRIIANQPVGMGWYVPICDHRGVIMNDPILLKLSETRFWLSIADSDMLFWARGIAGERGFDVEVFEPDVSPLAIQGPLAMDVAADLFGEDIRTLKYFEFRQAAPDGIPMMVARSGWSKQGGVELYLMDGKRGSELWDLVRSAGAPYGIGPGCPNSMERVESGLLSWGGDTDDKTNPFEVRMGRYVDVNCPDDVIGIQALRQIKADGPKRHQLGLKLNLDGALSASDRPADVVMDGKSVGKMTAQTWSPRLETNIGLCLVSRAYGPGDIVEVVMPDGRMCTAELAKLPFI